MRSDRRKPPRSQPRPDGTARLWVEQLDCRCLPSGGLPDVSSFAVVGPGVGVAAENQLAPTQPLLLPPVPVPPPPDVMTGGNVLLPPPPMTEIPERTSQPDGGDGGPMGGFEVFPGPGQSEPPSEVVANPVASYLLLLLPSPTFDGPLLAVPERAAVGRTATVDWGDGVITDAVFAPGVDGWLAVRVNRVLDGDATYNVNVRLAAADDPKDWLNIPLLVLTPPAPPTDGPSTWNATGYWPPVRVEVKPSEWLWVSLPVFESADLGPASPYDGGFTPPPPAPPPTPSESPPPPAGLPGPGPDVTQAPPPNAGPVLPSEPPATPAGPFTSPPRGVTPPVSTPVVHPASYSPFEAGATRAARAAAPRTPPPDPVAPRAGTRPAGSRADEKPTADPGPVASSTPAEEPESWDWVVALGVGPVELAAAPAPGRAARSDRAEGTSDHGAKDHDSPPPTENAQGTPAPRDAAPSDSGTAELWVLPLEAVRLLNPADAPIARQPARWSADGSPEAILAALADAPAPDAVFADAPAAAASPEDRREPWGWQSKAVALAAAVWAGVWFLWPRLGQWTRSVDPITVALDGPAPTRAEVARPAAPRSAELAVEPVAHS